MIKRRRKSMKKFLMIFFGLMLHNSLLFAELSMNAIDKLIRKFGPLVRVHPDDESSPSSVSWMLENSSLNFRNNSGNRATKMLLEKGKVTSKIIGNEPYNRGNLDGEYFLNLDGDKNKLKKGMGYDANNFSNADCYVNVVERADGNITLQFWFFFAWQGPIKLRIPFVDTILKEFDIGIHEGDWEHVNIHLKKNASQEYEIYQVFFARHQQRKGDLIKKDDKNLVLVNDQLKPDKNGTHPVVYTALNSHATYPKVLFLSKDVDTTSDKGPLWKCWEHGVYIGTRERPTRGQEWINFVGRWGSSVEAEKIGVNYHGDSPETMTMYGAFLQQGKTIFPLEINDKSEIDGKPNFVEIAKESIETKKISRNKRFSEYFDLLVPQRINKVEFIIDHPKKHVITYNIYEKKTGLPDKFLFGPLSGLKSEINLDGTTSGAITVAKDGEGFTLTIEHVE
jgi:hypothetical protein